MEEVDIANAALALLSQNAIEFLTDENANARKINAVFDNVRDEVLAAHAWNFAVKRANLTELGGLIIGWTDNGSDVWYATLATEPASVKFNYTVGTEVASIILCVAENNWFWDTTTSRLYVYSTADPDTEYTNPGIDAIIPEFDYDNAFALPSDCLRVIKLNDSYDNYEVENIGLVTNEVEAKIKYIARIEDPDEFSIGFVQAFVARLAAEICFAITHDAGLTQERFADFERKLSRAKTTDSQEGTPQVRDDEEWLNERL